MAIIISLEEIQDNRIRNIILEMLGAGAITTDVLPSLSREGVLPPSTIIKNGQIRTCACILHVP